MTAAGDDTPFTYPEVGATASALPGGYNYLRAARIVGNGRELFDHCGETILNWGIQSGAGFEVSNIGRVTEGSHNRLGLHWGPFKTWAICQVVYVINEPNRRGFAYGTLPGHPERGEECFIVSIDESQTVTFDIAAFSKPARWFSYVGAPLVRILQQYVTWKYLDAVHPPTLKRHTIAAATRRSYTSPDGSAWVKTGGPSHHANFERN